MARVRDSSTISQSSLHVLVQMSNNHIYGVRYNKEGSSSSLTPLALPGRSEIKNKTYGHCRGVENHSQVAECTRLILSVGCAWGQSMNARSRGVRTRKHTRIQSGSGRRSIIPYVHYVMYCLSLCASWGRSYACLCMCENLWDLVSV